MKTPVKHKLAIIIVNYNVVHFLEQCLNAVKAALKNISSEVIVVDNNSIDTSVEMVKSKFPEYRIIENKCNAGFSKANNQAIAETCSEFVLLLNPDTVIEEDTLKKVIGFMESHPDAGGLGVRMVDGKGRFLPESKRGLPTPMVAFYKIFGLSRLFPYSKTFGQYHAGHIHEHEISEIDVLSGAFMLLRMNALNICGLLDETFFMYGEDIDLSYRIQKSGYKNYYFPQTTIIHYKGESTKKTSVNYVFVFYQAMIIFARKHFSQKNAQLFSFFIHLAIYFRASIAVATRYLQRVTLPLIDAAILLTGLFALTIQWEKAAINFPLYTKNISIPLYLMLWLFGIFIQGGYDTPMVVKRLLKGVMYATLMIFIVYGMLPKNWQFSRLYILAGALWVFVYFMLSRIYLHFSLGKKFYLFPIKNKRYAIIGDLEEIKRVTEIICQNGGREAFIFNISSQNVRIENFIGDLSQLDQLVRFYELNELVFCAKNISAGEIIQWMTKISNEGVDFKIAQPDSLSLIGSNSIETAGEHYVLNLNSVSIRENARKKRILDVIVALTILTMSPLVIWFYQNKKKFISNLIFVLFGKSSLVGYNRTPALAPNFLPKLKPGILYPGDEWHAKDETFNDKLNLIYARDYNPYKDFIILSKAWKKLDR